MPAHVLITGATGFIASHTIAGLLERGYRVSGTVRDPAAQDANAHLLALPLAADRLTLVAADLTTEGAFDNYVGDVDYIIHMASPYALNVKDPQRELVEPAVHGTLSVLQAAAKAPQLKRVVLTSSVAAITDEPDENHVLNEEDWNEQSSLSRNPYYFSKTRAERAAWEFVEQHKPSWDLIAINPFLVAGPSMTKRINETPRLFVDMLNGKHPAIMALAWGIVDVRDVALAHINALTAQEANGRYLCAAQVRTMREVVTLLNTAGFTDGKLPSMSMEGPLATKLAIWTAFLQPKGAASYLRTHLGRKPRFDNSKIKNDLDLEFRDVDQTIVDTAIDLAQWGHVKQPKNI